MQAPTVLDPFDFRWPDGVEHFERGWDFTFEWDGRCVPVRHGLGAREVYGRRRVHSVTWVRGQPMVEGVEADDYPESRALISTLKIGGRKHVRTPGEIPQAYDDFIVVRVSNEIHAPYAPDSLGVKIVEDDLEAWARHALLRADSKNAPATTTRRLPRAQPPRVEAPTGQEVDPAAILVGCVSAKREGPAPAGDLYTSPLFAGRRAHAEASGKPWFVFSAEYGIVGPNDVIDWYDRTFKLESPEYARRKGEEVARQLEERFGSLAGRVFEIHAGREYVEALAEPLRRRGASLRQPLANLRVGEQLHWYQSRYPEARRRAGTSPSVRGVRPVVRERVHRAEPAPRPVFAPMPEATIVVARLDDRPTLVIERAGDLAYDFFRLDSSSVGDQPYDALARRTPPNIITNEDVSAINRTIRARSPLSAWEPLITHTGPLPWLAALDPDWELFAMDDGDWRANDCQRLLTAALKAAVGPYRNLSVATKVLHLKRPRLIPVLDSLVVQQLGGVLGTPAMTLLIHLRSVGRKNLDVLRTIQSVLAQRRFERSVVRILDALLWATHPAAGLGPELSAWETRIRPRPSAS